MRARLGTTARFCRMAVLESRDVPETSRTRKNHARKILFPENLILEVQAQADPPREKVGGVMRQTEVAPCASVTLDPTPASRNLIPEIRNLMPEALHLVPCTQSMVPATWILVQGYLAR